jgi:acyl-CoA reductase-like NAD-dependent aldehyde dehydrogenase
MSTGAIKLQALTSEHSQELGNARLAAEFFNIINGERCSSGDRLTVVNPATGHALATVPDIDRDSLDRAVSAARKALPAWGALAFTDRKKAVINILNVIQDNIEELGALLTAEQGHPVTGAKWEIEWLTKRYGPALQQIELSDEQIELEGVGHVTKRYVPLGVVCAISAWNLPVLLSLVKVLPALLTGNTVVLKPAPSAPLTVLRIADYVRGLLPPGVLNVVTGGDDLGPWMTSHPGFDKITFTGSTHTGKQILKSVASTLKHVTLELSGNDAGIVLPDGQPEEIAEALFWSMFVLNGQGCVCLKRLYVHEDVYAELATTLVAYASRITTGNGFEPGSALGPIQNRTQYDRLRSTWKEIEKSGVGVLYRGQIPNDTQGFFFPVTILDNPPDDADFVRNEVFGPIRSILKYRDLDEAIQRANNSSYGLGASVWGRDPEKLETVARQLQAGTVWINQHANLHPDLPFSGFKNSGLGVEFGRGGLKAFCNIQIISRK